MTTAEKIASNTVSQFLGKFVSMGVTIILTMLITRVYGVEGYGAFNLMVSFPALFYIISDFGINAISTRELSLDDKDINLHIGNVFILRFLLSVVLILLASVLLLFLPYDTKIKAGVLISLLLILTTSFNSSSNVGFQVRLRYDLTTYANSVGSLMSLLLSSVIIFSKGSIFLIVASFIFSEFIKALLSFMFLKKVGITPIFKFDSNLSKRLFVSSIPLGLMFIFSQINFKADSVLLSFLKLPASLNLNNIQTVGIYGLPYKVFEVSLIVPTFFMNSVYPIMVKNFSISKERLFSTFSKSTLILFLSGILCALFGFFLSEFVIFALGGKGFYQSVFILKVLLGTIFIFDLTQPLSWLIVTLKGQNYLPFIYLSASIANLLLNVLLIPKYSFYASVHITWISELLILFLLALTARRLWIKL